MLLLVAIQLSANAQQTYQLDIKKSRLIWSTGKTMGKHTGDIRFSSGTLNYSNPGKITNGSFKIDMNSMRAIEKEAADFQRVNKELKSPTFFDVVKHPTATMQVKQVNSTVNLDVYKVNGDLTIRGITHPISFLATIKKTGNEVRAIANLKIDRIKWNINHQQKRTTFNIVDIVKDKAMADEIPISLDLWFK